MDEPDFKPSCVFCHALWSDENVKLSDIAYDNYESTGPCSFEATVSLVCHACGREMYRKEGVSIY